MPTAMEIHTYARGPAVDPPPETRSPGFYPGPRIPDGVHVYLPTVCAPRRERSKTNNTNVDADADDRLMVIGSHFPP